MKKACEKNLEGRENEDDGRGKMKMMGGEGVEIRFR